MEFDGEPISEGANILSVYLAEPCFGDTTPTDSSSPIASQTVEKCEDGGRFGAYSALHDDEIGFEEDQSPGYESQRLPSQSQTSALIGLDGEDNAGAYDTLGAKQTRLYAHETLLGLSFKPSMQQVHEDLVDIEFEGHVERQTSNSAFSTAFQAPKQQVGMYAFTSKDQYLQESFEPMYGQANLNSSPGGSDDSFYGAEVDELEDDDVTKDVPWPDGQCGDRMDDLPSSSPPPIFSSSPGFPSSQTSLGNLDDGTGLEIPQEERRASPLFALKSHLLQMDSTEIKAHNFQDDAQSPAETNAQTGNSGIPGDLELEEDASGPELPSLDGQEASERAHKHEFILGSDAKSHSVWARGAAMPSSLPMRHALDHLNTEVVTPAVPFLRASASGHVEGYVEETGDRGTPRSSSPPAGEQEVVQLDASSGMINIEHMSVDSPRFGHYQDAELNHDEPCIIATPSSSIPDDLHGSQTKFMRYGRDLDSRPGVQVEDLGEDPIFSDSKTTPAGNYDTPPPPGGLDASPRPEDSRPLRAEAPLHNVTDKEEEGVAAHDGEKAQIQWEDSRGLPSSGEVKIGDSPTMDSYGHGTMRSTFKLPAIPRLFDKDAGLSHGHVEHDDNPVFNGYQEPQGPDVRSGSTALPEFPYRPEVEPPREPGPQVETSVFRSLKPGPSRASATAAGRESLRCSTLPSHPNPKRTTAAGQLLQHKKLSKPFKCPTVSNPPLTKSGAAHKSGPPQPLAQVKQEEQVTSYPQVEGPVKEDVKIKHRTQRAAAQFKSPLTIAPSGQQALFRPTPTIQALERRVQTLKRANRVVEDNEEATLQALVAKWTEAGREIAYELWTTVKDSGGEGSSSGRAMSGDLSRKRKVEEGWGWDDGNETKRLTMNSGSTSSWGWDPAPGGDSEHAAKDERHDASEEHDEEERGAVQGTIGIMLMQLGICPATLGWDEEEGCFVG